eukprot:SAG22_NODE_1079_length_5672_cov_4.668222_4_plen_287_part_00
MPYSAPAVASTPKPHPVTCVIIVLVCGSFLSSHAAAAALYRHGEGGSANEWMNEWQHVPAACRPLPRSRRPPSARLHAIDRPPRTEAPRNSMRASERVSGKTVGGGSSPQTALASRRRPSHRIMSPTWTPEPATPGTHLGNGSGPCRRNRTEQQCLRQKDSGSTAERQCLTTHLGNGSGPCRPPPQQPPPARPARRGAVCVCVCTARGERANATRAKERARARGGGGGGGRGGGGGGGGGAARQREGMRETETNREGERENARGRGRGMAAAQRETKQCKRLGSAM